MPAAPAMASGAGAVARPCPDLPRAPRERSRRAHHTRLRKLRECVGEVGALASSSRSAGRFGPIGSSTLSIGSSPRIIHVPGPCRPRRGSRDAAVGRCLSEALRPDRAVVAVRDGWPNFLSGSRSRRALPRAPPRGRRDSRPPHVPRAPRRAQPRDSSGDELAGTSGGATHGSPDNASRTICSTQRSRGDRRSEAPAARAGLAIAAPGDRSRAPGTPGRSRDRRPDPRREDRDRARTDPRARPGVFLRPRARPARAREADRSSSRRPRLHRPGASEAATRARRPWTRARWARRGGAAPVPGRARARSARDADPPLRSVGDATERA